MPKVIKKRVTKHKAEEGVKDIIRDTKDFVSGRQKIIIPLLTVIVVSILTIAGFFIYRANISSRAGSLEYDAYKIYYGLYQKQPLQKEEQYQRALEEFKKAYEIRKSPFSLFYIASCYYDMDKPAEALRYLKELNERFPDDERYVPLSYYKMAVIYIRGGDYDSGLKLLDTLYNYKTTSFKDLALLESARVLSIKGKTEDSLKKYEELKKNFPDSPFAGEAQAKLGEKKS